MVGPGLVLKVEFQAEALSVGRVLVTVTSSSSQIRCVEMDLSGVTTTSLAGLIGDDAPFWQGLISFITIMNQTKFVSGKPVAATLNKRQRVIVLYMPLNRK